MATTAVRTTRTNSKSKNGSNIPQGISPVQFIPDQADLEAAKIINEVRKQSKSRKPAAALIEEHIANIEANEEATPAPEVSLPVLNKKEMKVLEAIFEGIHAETRTSYCYFDSFDVAGMTESQQKGYVSQLAQKNLIAVDQEAGCINLTKLALQVVNLDFLLSFKHGFDAIDYVAPETEPKAPKAEKKTILSGKGARRIGQVVRRVYRARKVSVSVTYNPETKLYTVRLQEGAGPKFWSIFQSQFDIKANATAQDYSYIEFYDPTDMPATSKVPTV